MNNESDPLLLDHEIDGIRELDNKLPRWWVWLFYCTIIFAVGYLAYYHVLGSGKMMETEYQNEMKIGSVLKAAAMTRFEASIPSLEPSKDPVVIAAGKQTFKASALRVIAKTPVDRLGRTLRMTTGFTGRSFPTTSPQSGTGCRQREWSPGRIRCGPTRSSRWPVTSIRCAARR